MAKNQKMPPLNSLDGTEVSAQPLASNYIYLFEDPFLAGSSNETVSLANTLIAAL